MSFLNVVGSVDYQLLLI
uniref:Uncharacterized protein n=1 Tax=Lepeophtheirus salmonis TaxID=72036 RepID=A0A0K2V6B7_LEPSM